jgi:hypothetical protein
MFPKSEAGKKDAGPDFARLLPNRFGDTLEYHNGRDPENHDRSESS